jgi:hypothetical protein
MTISTFLRGMRAQVRKISHEHPLLSNAVMYGGLYTLAEVSQQKLRNANMGAASPVPVISGGATSATSQMPLMRVSPPTREIHELGQGGGAAKPLAALPSTPSHVHRLDMSSVKRYAIMGTLVIPPILTKWYHWLDNKFPSTSKRTVMKKLILDQFLLTPWLLAMFFIGMAFLEGSKGKDLLTELKAKFTMTFIMDCCFWLPIQALNFLFVHPTFRVVYIGVTTFIWMNILCFIKAGPH